MRWLPVRVQHRATEGKVLLTCLCLNRDHPGVLLCRSSDHVTEDTACMHVQQLAEVKQYALAVPMLVDLAGVPFTDKVARSRCSAVGGGAVGLLPAV